MLQKIPKGSELPTAVMDCETGFNFEECDTFACPIELCTNIWNNGVYIGYGCTWGGGAPDEICKCSFQHGVRGGMVISCGCEWLSWK